MIQFIAAAAVGVGIYAAAKTISREMKRVSDFLDREGGDAHPPLKTMRLERDESTGHYKPVPVDERTGSSNGQR